MKVAVRKFMAKGWKPILLSALMLGFLAASTAFAERGAGNPKVAPPNSSAYGHSLADWLTIYWEWAIGGADPAQSKVGDVQLMPLPAGELVPNTDPPVYKGQLEITIPAGTPIVLPAFALYGETYNNGLPNDVPIADDVILASVHPNMTIDGVPVLTEANKAAFYVPPVYFAEPIVYPEPTSYGSVSAIFFQGDGVVIKPLPVGQHTIHLYEPWILTGYWALVYDNTWLVTVTPR